jgi:sporulation protein YlmC with PRC-barrel domain
MKKLLTIVLAAAVGTAFTAAVGSAQAPTTRDDAARSADKRPAFRMDQELWETKQLVGARVKSSDGKDLGEVDQLLVDPKDGKITHAVIGIGGLAGIGEQKVVVKWSDVQVAMDPAKKRPAATVSQTALDSAPRYDRRAMSTDRSPSASPRMTPRDSGKPKTGGDSDK